ncbi:MAG: molybdenum cofactor guanylyltransferase [Phycisphaerales bacterium]|nr:MAG: molybdenum cofactor guanylyltransferase [Phycisphaerales bacterium]
MIQIPGMLMVGSRCKSDGKTVFTRALIERFRSIHEIVGVKVTIVDSFNKSHHPQISGSQTDGSYMGPWYITEEKDPRSNTDTGRMLAAGAKRVLWLLAQKSHLERAVDALAETLGEETVSICESNRARSAIEPDAFIIILGKDNRAWKPSAREMAGYADRIVLSDGTGFDIDPKDIQLLDGRWIVRMPATAIILAGGGSRRMGQDKTMLPIAGQPMIKHVHEKVRPYFTQTLVSSNNSNLHDLLGATIVPDEVTGRGPIMGIVSTLKVSANDVNFVIACDIPEFDAGLIKAMLRQARDYDAVVPRVGPGLYEPLFAVYRKSALPAMEELLRSGNNKIIDALGRCRVRYFDLPGRRFSNINTWAEYHSLIGEKTDASV